MATAPETLLRTPLYDLHVKLGARIVPFAGFEMPVQYPTGILTEHNWTRSSAGLFDVSHMGQALLVGPDHATTARAIEKLVPGDVAGLAPGRIRYTQITNPEGGIIDDLMITRPAAPGDDGKLGIVVNASRKHVDYAWLSGHLPKGVTLEPIEDRALVALQGPKAAQVLARYCTKVADMAFMSAAQAEFDGVACAVARSGYTGEDGYEISVAADKVEAMVETLLADPEVKPIGLGARDSLRLEAGLCLYGHDIDEETSPVEADLVWSIGKKRRSEGGFTGAERITREIAEGPKRKRVGIRPEGRAPARENTVVINEEGRAIGLVTSGGFGPTVNGPVAMGYVETAYAAPGTKINLVVRDKPMPAQVVALPFTPHNYKR
ncbi:glycine cleavage system aminomethyltransferase GcvT [Taklimakanibacter lacteus]|uniref:glycine cleavage system aminomethyltransferase GcvT n=1 Tax=Taklimakanibacter lacteus TaxID=2268456 RepID=UPI000E672300